MPLVKPFSMGILSTITTFYSLGHDAFNVCHIFCFSFSDLYELDAPKSFVLVIRELKINNIIQQELVANMTNRIGFAIKKIVKLRMYYYELLIKCDHLH